MDGAAPPEFTEEYVKEHRYAIDLSRERRFGMAVPPINYGYIYIYYPALVPDGLEEMSVAHMYQALFVAASI